MTLCLMALLLEEHENGNAIPDATSAFRNRVQPNLDRGCRRLLSKDYAILAMVIVPAIRIAVVVAIPSMIVIETSVRSIPIARVELSTFVTRTNPACAFIGRPAPIAFVPTIVATGRIPIAIDP